MDDIRRAFIDRHPDFLTGAGEWSKIEKEFEKRTIMRIMAKRYQAGLYMKSYNDIESTIPKPVKESTLRDWIWLTVNPKPEVSLEEFRNIFLNCPSLLNYIYTLLEYFSLHQFL